MHRRRLDSRRFTHRFRAFHVSALAGRHALPGQGLEYVKANYTEV